MSPEAWALFRQAYRWLLYLDEPANLSDIGEWGRRAAVVLASEHPPKQTPCPICPHWMEWHGDDGTCSCGAHG